MGRPLDDAGLDTIFRTARSYNGYTDEPVTDDEFATANGLFQKYAYDGLGRIVASFTSYDTDDGQALTRVLTALPGDLAAPIAMVLFHGSLAS